LTHVAEAGQSSAMSVDPTDAGAKSGADAASTSGDGDAREPYVYPRPEDEARFPFERHEIEQYDAGEQVRRGRAFHDLMQRRRSVRTFASTPVPRELVEVAIATAASAPSGAHQQPWTFVLVGDADMKRRIREAAEHEERINYGATVTEGAVARPTDSGGRMNAEWQEALAPLGTHWSKGYLEDAPWLVVVFEQRYGLRADGSHRHHYYVRESVGIACGLFIASLHTMGLATLTHTPSPMAFLSTLLGRPENERPSILFPVGYPSDDAKVPVLSRKPLAEVLIEVIAPPA
jgi:iodotyrosine deiodinase